WRAFRHPIVEEKARVLKERWESLPAELRTNNQISGRHLTHCGFTLGASYCSFHCTHCYLPKNANEIPIPSLAQVKEQIDANRRFQGPGGGLQITGGDVADAYWKSGRTDELVEIVRYAYQVGLVPMLMTHGQTLLEQPQFLERLVVEGGLRQVSVHVDLTQAGRHGYPIQRVKHESDLHPVREAFTQLARDICEGTGFPLEQGGTNFGHPDCNSWASILISRRTGKTIPLLPTDTTTKRLLGRILEQIGGLSLVTDDARTTPWRLAGILAQNPGL